MLTSSPVRVITGAHQMLVAVITKDFITQVIFIVVPQAHLGWGLDAVML